MARMERTVYRTLKQNFTQEEIAFHFSPSLEEALWAKRTIRKLKSRICLLVNLKVFQYLGYFTPYKSIPKLIMACIRSILGASAAVEATYLDSDMLYKHRDMIRNYLEILPWGRESLHIALSKAVELAAVMDNPVDLANAVIETLIRDRCELPAFRTLDRLVRRVRSLVNRRIFVFVNARCSTPVLFEALLEKKQGESRTDFNRLKEDAPNATFMHLKELTERFLNIVLLTRNIYHNLLGLPEKIEQCGDGKINQRFLYSMNGEEKKDFNSTKTEYLRSGGW